MSDFGPPFYCSFCGKSNSEVFCLFAGPTVFICDECIDFCAELLAEKRSGTPGEIEYRSWLLP